MAAPDLVMHFDAQGVLLDSAKECEAEVFSRWFGNTREQLAQEYDPYDDSTVFLTIADRDNQVQGCIRLLAPGGRRGLKTLVDIGGEPWGVDGLRSAASVGIDLRSSWDVATLGVHPRIRGADGSKLSRALFHGLLAVARVNRMSSAMAILDERVRRMMTAMGLITHPLPGTATGPYLGSRASTPVYCHLTPMLENQRRRFPDAYRLVTLGIGLDGIAVPPLEAFRLRRPGQVLDLTRHEVVLEAQPRVS